MRPHYRTSRSGPHKIVNRLSSSRRPNSSGRNKALEAAALRTIAAAKPCPAVHRTLSGPRTPRTALGAAVRGDTMKQPPRLRGGFAVQGLAQERDNVEEDCG